MQELQAQPTVGTRQGRPWIALVVDIPLLSLLFFIQPNFVMAAPWLVAFIYLVFRIYRAFKAGIQWGVRRLRGQTATMDWWALGRALPALIILPSAFAWQQTVQGMAEQYARDVSKQIQEACRIQRECPVRPDGWQPRGDMNMERYYRKHRRVYRLLYRVSEDRQQFHMRLRYSLDNNLHFVGGVDRELIEQLQRSSFHHEPVPVQ